MVSFTSTCSCSAGKVNGLAHLTMAVREPTQCLGVDGDKWSSRLARSHSASGIRHLGPGGTVVWTGATGLTTSQSP